MFRLVEMSAEEIVAKAWALREWDGNDIIDF